MKRLIARSCALLGCLLAAQGLRADTDPKDVIPAPPGTDAIVVYSKMISASKMYAEGTEVQGFGLNANMGILRPVHYSSLGGHTYCLQLLVPYGNMTLDGAAVGNNRFQSSGLGDIQANMTYWFLADYKESKYAGAGLFLVAPTGEHNDQSAVNLGDKRWSLRPQYLMGRSFGKTFCELGAEYSVYSDYTTASKVTSKKDPLYNVFAHVTYDIKPGLFFAGSMFYTRGGETKVNGVRQHDQSDATAAMWTLGYSLTPQSQVLLQFRQDVAVHNGPSTAQLNGRFLVLF